MAQKINNAEVSTELEEDNQRFKVPRIRSSAYPSYTIEFCCEFTKKFHQHFGNSSYIQREEVAKVLKISVGHIQTQLSASVQYGLAEMKSKVGYKPSKLFLRVYKPISDEEKKEALIDCLLNPEIYRKLLIQFQGGVVPTVTALSTILFRNHNIAEAASQSAAQIFIDNLKFLQLLDKDNNLLLDREIQLDVEQPKLIRESEIKEKPIERFITQRREGIYPKKTEVPLPDQADSYPILVPLKNNRQARLILPSDFKNEDLDKVEKFIEALRE